MKVVLILIGLIVLNACVGPLPAPSPVGQLHEETGGIICVDIPKSLGEVKELLRTQDEENGKGSDSGTFHMIAGNRTIRIDAIYLANEMTQLRIQYQELESEPNKPNSLRLWSRTLVKDLLP